jgi:ubiquinone/menaquinone biosynthesis C-methylase UbiE
VVQSAPLRGVLRRPDASARWLAAQLPPGAQRVLELGAGSAALTQRLARRVGCEVVTADLSLRAVLRARGERAGLVCDAEALPVRQGAFDAIVAEHLVDLLEAPLPFLVACARALKRHGTFLAATVEPALGGSSDDTFARLVHQAGLRVTLTRDGALWPRVHSPRRVELYVDFLLEAVKP